LRSVILIFASAVFVVALCAPSFVEGETTEITGVVPLLVSEVALSAITPSMAKISWTTNGGSTSQVIYDTIPHDDPDEYSLSTPVRQDLISVHRVTLSGLVAGRTYHFRVISTVENMMAVSDDLSFTTRTRGRSPKWNWDWWRW